MTPRSLTLLFLLSTGILSAQTDAEIDALMHPKVERIKNLRTDAKETGENDVSIQREASELTPYLQTYLTEQLKQQGYRFALSEIEESRFSKQTGSGAGAAGTTSVVSKGSVPALFGLAVENGALTRSVSGTTVTFRTSPANVYAALAKGGYVDAGPAVPPLDGSFLALARRMSVYVSFDTSRGNSGTTNTLTGDKQQLAGWGSRVELFNKRDPRRPEYKRAWNTLMDTKGRTFINDMENLTTQLSRLPEFQTWRKQVEDDILKAKTDDVPATLRAAFKSFQPIAKNNPELKNQLERAAMSAYEFATSRAGTINSIMKSWTAAVEYNFTKQANTTGLTAASALPDLGNFNLVISQGFTNGPELTFNAGITWFQSIPSGLNVGTVRDAQASLQLDFPLKPIDKIGKPVLSFAGQFLSLREEPLGAKVIVNTVPVTAKGNIGLLQAKFTIPTKNSGVSVPISVTWSNRTELIKEKDVRASFGLSFDMDKLFVKP